MEKISKKLKDTKSKTMDYGLKTKTSVNKTPSIELSLEPPAEDKLLMRRSTSPMFLVGGENIDELDAEIDLSKSPSPMQSRASSRKNSAASKSSSRKSSFSACLSPNRSPRGSLDANSSPDAASKKQFLTPDSIFNLPKPKVTLLKKTASVKQLYNSVLHALRTLSRSKDDHILPELTKTFFEKILQDSERRPGLQVTKVKVRDGNDFGRHFCSEVHAIEVTVKYKEVEAGGKGAAAAASAGGITCVYQLIVKSQPQSEDARNFLQPSHTFEKEVQMYSTVFIDMANFVKGQGIISSNCHESEVVDIPRCYYTRWTGDNQKDDMIVLENLIPQGFMFIENGDPLMNKLHAEITIKEIAKFHAISFCMKKGDNKNLIERYPFLKEDSLYREDTFEFHRRTLTPVMASLAELIRTTPEYEAQYEWFVELAKNFHSIQTQLVKPEGNLAVICHGDLWLSNILFRYEAEVEGEGSPRPTEVKFIDFQSSRIASLATDILAFAFTSLSSELRREHMCDLLHMYYTNFIVSIRSLNYTDPVFSLEDLFKEFEDHVLFGFLEGIWFLDIIYQGQRPKTYEKEEPDIVNIEADFNAEDEREALEILKKERMMKETETAEEESYKLEFFKMLEDVLILLGENDSRPSAKLKGALQTKSGEGGAEANNVSR